VSATIYNTVEWVVNTPDVPAWSYYWPGSGGCNGVNCWHGARTFSDPPSGVPIVYYPFDQSGPIRGPMQKGRRKGYPPFRYTPWSISKRTYRRYLIKRTRLSNTGNYVYQQYGLVSRIGSSCVAQPTVVDIIGPRYNIWKEVAHDYPNAQTYVVHGFAQSDIDDAISSVENQVSKDSLTTYDALTDAAELKDVPRLVSQVSGDLRKILQTLRGRHGRAAMRAFASMTPQKLLRSASKAARQFGGDWMAYRYGIMPLVYSYRDIVKQANRHTISKDRAFRGVTPRDLSVTLPGPTVTYKKVSIEGTIDIRGSIFQAFSSAEVSRASGLGLNPLLTAWELMPYSFVIDWFVNIGDYIARKTSQSFAQKSWACLSRRDNYTISTWVHLPTLIESCSMSNLLPIGWQGSQPPSPPPITFTNEEGYYILQEEVVDAYHRWLFDVRGAQLSLNPSLNWKRYTDSAVMSINLLRTLMKFLRRS